MLTYFVSCVAHTQGTNDEGLDDMSIQLTFRKEYQPKVHLCVVFSINCVLYIIHVLFSPIFGLAHHYFHGLDIFLTIV